MKTFDYSLVKDPQYFCDNRMEAHSDHVYYKDKKEMQTALQEGDGTSFRYCLNGLWKFHYARNYANVIPGFEKEEYCCYDWEDIHVPAHIQMEGYDAPSMLMSSIHGKDMRKFIRVRFRRDLIRLQAM